MPTQSKEHYLKALYQLHQKNESISITDLSKTLLVSKPSVTNMIKKLKEKGWVNYERYQPIQFTNQGMKAARLVVRKHRLAEMFLQQVMGFGWEEVHEIAEEIEHIDDEKLFDRMDEMLGFPEIDPHGSPIPSKDGTIKKLNLVQLSTVAPSSNVIIRALKQSNQAFLQFLTKRNLQLGTELFIHAREDYDQSMEVSYENQKLTLSQEVCENLLVQLK